MDSTTNTTTTSNNPNDEMTEVVELATLLLPVSATEDGLATGQDAQVTLEASKETVESLQQEETGGISSMISAVVDLEKLSELVGVSEDEFITGLHQDVKDSRIESETDEPDDTTAAEAEAAAAAVDEESPLLEHTHTCTCTATEPAETESSTTEQIKLSADPFIERLAEVLPTVDEYSVLGNESLLHCEATATVSGTTAAVISRGGAGDDDDQNHEPPHHFAHDAFLLKTTIDDAAAPTGTGTHHHEARFILALPDIHMHEPSQQTDLSELSEGSARFFSAATLERAMTLLPTELPTDIQEVHFEATEHVPTKADPTTVHLDMVVERQVPFIGYVILFGGLFALASVGAALDLQDGGATPILKTLWRQMATCLVLVPFVIQSLRHDGVPKLTDSEWMLLPVGAAAYTYMTLAFVLAMEMTTLADAFVLSNMTSIVIIAARAVLGQPTLVMEIIGAVIGFSGAAICSGDAPSPHDDAIVTSNASPNTAMYGNLVALSASFGTATYLLIAKDLRPKMDLFCFMFLIMGLGDIFLLLFSIVQGQNITFDLDPVHGLFGWMQLQANRLPLELYIAVVCNCLGTMGYIAVLKYFDAIVPATVMLLEPAVGALLGTAAGTAPLPGLQTWLGNLVVAGGTFLVVQAEAHKTESIDATEAIRPRLDIEREEIKDSVNINDNGSAKVIWDIGNKVSTIDIA